MYGIGDKVFEGVHPPSEERSIFNDKTEEIESRDIHLRQWLHGAGCSINGPCKLGFSPQEVLILDPSRA